MNRIIVPLLLSVALPSLALAAERDAGAAAHAARPTGPTTTSRPDTVASTPADTQAAQTNTDAPTPDPNTGTTAKQAATPESANAYAIDSATGPYRLSAPRPPIAAAIPPSPLGPVPGPVKPASDRGENPFQGDPSAAVNGRRLFVAFNCSGCHGGHAGGGMGPSLRDADWIYGKRPADIFDSVSQGRAHGMPAWGTLLPPEYVWQLVSYIDALRAPNEPDPPQ